jgi:hypothetical protein
VCVHAGIVLLHFITLFTFKLFMAHDWYTVKPKHQNLLTFTRCITASIKHLSQASKVWQSQKGMDFTNLCLSQTRHFPGVLGKQEVLAVQGK